MDLNMVKYKASVAAAGALYLAKLLLRQRDGNEENEGPLWVGHTQRIQACTFFLAHSIECCLCKETI